MSALRNSLAVIRNRRDTHRTMRRAGGKMNWWMSCWEHSQSFSWLGDGRKENISCKISFGILSMYATVMAR
jgi:hypothetical protein